MEYFRHSDEIRRSVSYFHRLELSYKIMLKQKILSDLKDAMKSGDKEKRDVLRMFDSMVKNVEIEKGKREDGLNDEEIIEVLSRAIKQRKESAEQYRKGGREDLAEKEKSEAEILSKYLPEQMSEEDLKKVIAEAVEESGIKDKSGMGKVMGIVMGKAKGRADGNEVRKIVEEIFNSPK